MCIAVRLAHVCSYLSGALPERDADGDKDDASEGDKGGIPLLRASPPPKRDPYEGAHVRARLCTDGDAAVVCGLPWNALECLGMPAAVTVPGTALCALAQKFCVPLKCGRPGGRESPRAPGTAVCICRDTQHALHYLHTQMQPQHAVLPYTSAGKSHAALVYTLGQSCLAAIERSKVGVAPHIHMHTHICLLMHLFTSACI